MKTAFTKFLWILVAGSATISVIQACGDDETASSGSNNGNTSTSPASSSASGMTNCMSAGFDPMCEQCTIDNCMNESLGCANESMCDAAGNPTAGCLALASCARENCADAPQLELCVAMMCPDELESAGGPAGAGTMALQDLYGCVQTNCVTECGIGGAGGAGSGGGGAGGN
jgi:hypothetical protein